MQFHTISKFSSLLVLIVLLVIPLSNCEWHAHTGPWVNATEGEPWPPSQSRTVYAEDYFLLNVSEFNFVTNENLEGKTCDILDDAIQRYQNIITAESKIAAKLGSNIELQNDPNFKGFLTALQIRLLNQQSCHQFPHTFMDESYILQVYNYGTKTAILQANEIWGILRGLESFSQLIFPSRKDSLLKIKNQFLRDRPFFKYRGLLLDTSRHYLPMSDILLTLDAMSYNKLNVFHWHIVDDNSFPYQSKIFPDLSAKGAYHPTMIYTQEDVRKVINYARLRGIRVIPEFDTPGHTASWGSAYPELLTSCYDKNGNEPTGELGPINPTEPLVYDFVKRLFSEITQVFPDSYLHLGGDEVPFDCWKSNPDIKDYMNDNSIKNYKKLEEMYILKVINITNSLNATPIVWQEVFDNNVTLPLNTLVHVWTGNFLEEMKKVTQKGYQVILSACWYLDHIAGGGDWKKYYICNPLDFYGGNKKLVLGGEACMWSEFVDRNNVHQRIWPRASAVAGRLWSYTNDNLSWVAMRLEEHACRMNRRGIPAQPPNGAGFCII